MPTLLSDDARDAIAAHAESRPDTEVCGIVLSVADSQRVVRLTNVAEPVESRAWQFKVAPEELWRALNDNAESEVIAVYHSHVDQAAYPSQMDVAMWATPNITCAIYSVLGADLNEYTIDAGMVTPL